MAMLMCLFVGCKSITIMGLSGNIMQISGAISMGFVLAQYPCISVVEFNNCYIS